MPDYKKMYYSLFNDVTAAITALQQAQQKTEQLYVEDAEPVINIAKDGPKPKKLEPSRDER